MARVPVYESGQVGLSDRPTPQQNINAPAEAFGAGLGNAVAGLGQEIGQQGAALGQRAIDIQQRANAATADDMTVQWTQKRNELLFDKPESYYNLQGKDAFEKRKEFEDQLVELRDSMSGGANNEHTRQLFDQQTRRDVMLTMSNMASHAASGWRNWQKDSSEGAMTSLIEQAGLSRTKDELDSRVGDIIDFTFSNEYYNKLDPYSHENTTRDSVGKAYGAYVGALSLNDPEAALDFFKEHRDMFPIEQAANMERNLTALAIPQRAEDIARKVKDGVLGGPLPSVDGMLSHIINKYEGTQKVIDSNGAPVRMGINLKHNPDVNLDTLTEAKAIEIYKERYWAPIASENIPADMALTALDSSIWAGPGRTKQWLRQADGDLAKFTELRLAWARSLKHYTKYGRAWENRIKDAAEQGAAAAPQIQPRREVLADLPEALERVRAMGLPAPQEKATIASVKQLFAEEATVRDAAYKNAQQTALGVAMGGPEAAGAPKTVAEANKDPEFQKAYLELTPADQYRISNIIRGNNRASSEPMTPGLIRRFETAKVEAALSPETFLKRDFYAEQERAHDNNMPYPNSLLAKLVNLQADTIGKSAKDLNPNVKMAMTLKPVTMLLRDVGITDKQGHIKKGKRDDYISFWGEMWASRTSRAISKKVSAMTTSHSGER